MGKISNKVRIGNHYFRYLFSYMTVLLIPLTILTFFYSASFIKKFREEIYETVDMELHQISTQLENELDAMEKIIIQLTLAKAMEKASAAGNPYELSPIIASLSGYLSANPFIHDIILTVDANPYLVTSTTTCEQDYYFTSILQQPILPEKIKSALLNNHYLPICLPPISAVNINNDPASQNTVFFLYPLFTDYQQPAGAALFQVKYSRIKGLMNQKLQSYDAQILITDENGTVIIAQGLDDRIDGITARIASFQNVGAGQMLVGQESYLVRTYQSDRNHWQYLAFIPSNQSTFSQIDAIRRDFLTAIFIILILASFTIYITQKFNYAPIRQLRDKAKQIFPEKNAKDELVTIANALDYLSVQNNFLSTKLASSHTAVLNERLQRLLSGNYGSRELFNLDCSELELSLPNPFFIVAILMLHTPIENRETFALNLKNQCFTPYIYFYLHNLHPNQIVLLLNLPDENQSPVDILQPIQSYIDQNFHLSATIGIGSRVDHTPAIPQSYMEAVSALDYRFVKGNGSVIEVKEVLDPVEAKILFPQHEFEVLQNALLSNNEHSIRKGIDSIIHFMEANRLPLYLARSICFHLIHVVNEHGRGGKNPVANAPLELSGMETAQEIIRMLYEWSDGLSTLAATRAKQIEIDEVIKYIHEHCLSCDFSAYETAEHFAMTLPGFSKYFKDKTGQNVMEYTINLRIREAKRLLRTTSLPLKEIGEKVGYYNLSSFTRRFKIRQGVTPSEYRRSEKDE